jgi:hypothetical protein
VFLCNLLSLLSFPVLICLYLYYMFGLFLLPPLVASFIALLPCFP